jgi:arylsulfatase A-like enzyme
LLCVAACLPLQLTGAERPSVLFVNVDDWNDWNEVLKGHSQAITPNIKRLAERGVVFSNAICASPTCLPSRTAVFSGIHPARSGNIVNDNGIHPWRFYVPDAVTLPKHLSRNGWKSIGIGKNFHGGDKPEFDTYIGLSKNVRTIKGSGIKLNSSGVWGVAAVPTTEMPDYIAASRGIEQIKSVDEPLFLSFGIYRPHVPWVVPQKYFDMYPPETLQFSERRADDLEDLPERFKLLAHLESKFGKGYNQKLADKGYDKQFVRAYLACVTFADEQLGRILDAWDASPHAADGYIVLWSDHGYMLGEKEAWSKMKPWYDSAHCNLIIAGPGIQKGAVCNKAVSLQDLYPTLVDLLKTPSPPQEIDGESLVPLLNNAKADWDKPVVMSSEVDGIRYDVVLDNDFRMTRLITGETELYKLTDDPHEFTNLAANPEYAPVIARLSKHLTFGYPAVTANTWIEAEATARQTSSDYKLRGNCHFPRALAGASGERVISANLHAGKGSYIDFVLDVQTPGTYSLAATLSVGGACTVLVDDVVDNAAQADTGYPMQTVGTVAPTGNELKDVSIGSATFERRGLKLIRFMSDVPKQALKIDRLQFMTGNRAPYPKADVPAKTVPQVPAVKSGGARKTSWRSQAEWTQDKPTVAWVFPFIDKNGDGRIDSAEYEALQVFKKKHRDWQAQARKALGLAAGKNR